MYTYMYVYIYFLVYVYIYIHIYIYIGTPAFQMGVTGHSTVNPLTTTIHEFATPHVFFCACNFETSHNRWAVIKTLVIYCI